MAKTSLPANSVLLLDALTERTGQLYTSPRKILQCRDLDDVQAFLQDVEAHRRQGAHLAGFLAYELGFAFEDKLKARWKSTGDLLGWFGVYDGFETLSLDQVRARLGDEGETLSPRLAEPRFDMGRDAYDAAFARCQAHLACGDIYQVNFTLRARFLHEGTPERQFLELLKRQPVAHAAFVKLQDRSIVSLSPELFLKRRGNRLESRPMKGTAPRGNDHREDLRIARELAADPKQRSENIMILDLMRNDLSRISETGSVKVTSLCEVERYKSLHQMTSTVEGALLPDMAFPQIIERLFPCGSITGAPKLSAMTIADTLETSPRGVYTGSIGAIAPNGDFKFNVAIRTLVLKTDGTGEVGTGSGVVYDSGAAPEYDECKLKLKFMRADSVPEFALLETMAYWPDDGILLKQRHLRRLEAAASYFGMRYSPAEIERALHDKIRDHDGPLRLRLTLDSDGYIDVTATQLTETPADALWKLALAPKVISGELPFRLHKTTHRAFYDDVRVDLSKQTGCQEVLFSNEEGFLTEGSFTSLFIQQAGRLLTPALRHGLLPGTLRAALLESGRAIEADLRPDDLKMAEKIFVGNSVRGLIRAEMVGL
ncbi:aminodeoxychorismate synthase component I [Roseibium sp. CAU 1637]|uniref:Probable branched-chain-amino-acid aminotransferase n=1 Tax=Roseibium limicola TaxID=2816037 RepID=A0A939J6Z4_9HYPH|nr:aminodeoxychorismate synthase component I [Roseibium limicola]MBO0345622.1 aminodeoxychorismate synthase component I [Roseibium limicola]